jgi:hypothetical protein
VRDKTKQVRVSPALFNTAGECDVFLQCAQRVT